jgi:hypothetical protein
MSEVQGSEKERRTLTLKINSVYYVINNTCIYLMVNSSNIYIYRREEYIKNYLKIQ